TSASRVGSLTMRVDAWVTPSASLRTISERRRCRSMPTYCPSIGASLSVRGERPECSPLGFPQGAEAPLLHRITCVHGYWPSHPVGREGGGPPCGVRSTSTVPYGVPFRDAATRARTSRRGHSCTAASFP